MSSPSLVYRPMCHEPGRLPWQHAADCLEGLRHKATLVRGGVAAGYRWTRPVKGKERGVTGMSVQNRTAPGAAEYLAWLLLEQLSE